MSTIASATNAADATKTDATNAASATNAVDATNADATNAVGICYHCWCY